ncbi:hypothetical protein PAP_06965 [Palaeococcus pacificus DY20341]|uniref:Type I restriction enzyme R protein N-terminal domain-containing protein n=1 Tax=Palaeococcus pacificus DY20341 TaxID=1343739 RepID=A0A075LSQ3_9EURY|nr:type I restriction enzyme HsdR N-terminal domain-containing protein [Palaeococcus pacificus]AIF69785.1 hypothetical protein PAP_06965 [Palaeococcus pacificus DY20341]
MEDVERVISNILEKVKNHRKLYDANEEAVKQHLIGEIFEVLGWEWQNPNEVRPEERTEDGRADYALVLGGKVISFVEAKNLSVKILKNEKPLRQLGKYCFSRGVTYGILTNGLQWIVIKAFEEGSTLKDRILFLVDLEKEPPKRSALKLSLLSKSRIKELERLAKLLQYFEESFRALKREGFDEDELIGYLRSEGMLKGLLPIVPISSIDTTDEEPKKVYIYESSRKVLESQIKGWYDVLSTVLEYLLIAADLREEERKELSTLYKYSKKIPKEKILTLLKEIERHFNVRISIEFS